MSKRVTILIDDDLYEKIRKLQAKQITESKGNMSFSRTINQILTRAFKK